MLQECVRDEKQAIITDSLVRRRFSQYDFSILVVPFDEPAAVQGLGLLAVFGESLPPDLARIVPVSRIVTVGSLFRFFGELRYAFPGLGHDDWMLPRTWQHGNNWDKKGPLGPRNGNITCAAY